MCFGKVKRSQTKAFLEKGFPLVSAGEGAVGRTLRTEHCFVACDAVLMFFAIPKTRANYFLWNWNRKLAKFLHFHCLCCVRTVSWYARASVCSAAWPTVWLIRQAVSSPHHFQPDLKKIGKFLPVSTTPVLWPTSKHSAVKHLYL